MLWCCHGAPAQIKTSVLQVQYKHRNKWYFLKIMYFNKNKIIIALRYNQNLYYFITALKIYLNISVINSGQIFTANQMVYKIQLSPLANHQILVK